MELFSEIFGGPENFGSDKCKCPTTRPKDECIPNLVSTTDSIITWVRVWVRVLVDEYEYKYEYWPVIYILYKQQYCIFQSLKRESSDSYKPGTKLQLHAHCPCKFPLSIYICVTILCYLVQWHFNLCIATYWLLWLTTTTCCQFKNRKQKLCNIIKCVEISVFFSSLK